MKNIFQILLFSLALACVASCNPASGFALLDVDEPYFNGLTSVHTRALVQNDSRKDLTVENATLFFHYRNRELATARLMLPATVHAASTERVRVDLKLESGSLANLQALQRRAETNPDQLIVSVRARVCFGKMKRVVEMRDIPFSAIISNFEAINGLK